MLVTPPPDALGAANVAGVLTALLALLAASAFVLLLWALIELYTRLMRNRGSSTCSRRRWSLADVWAVLMTPLEVDLATVETFPTVQSVQSVPFLEDAADAAALTATLPASHAPPATPPVGSSLAVLDRSEDDSDASWPPHPRTPGAKRYRYILASSQLVRLAGLWPYGIRQPRWFELN